MRVLQHSFNGLDLILRLNADRLLAVAAIGTALTLGAWCATFL